MSKEVKEEKTIQTHPDFSQWTKQEIFKRRNALYDLNSKLQPRIMKAERLYYLAVENQNIAVNKGDAETAAKCVFEAANRKREIAELKAERTALTQERLQLEAWDRELENARYITGPAVYICDKNMTRIS